MNYKPILFSGEMVRAILDGRKNQTRRIVKPQPIVNFTGDHSVEIEWLGVLTKRSGGQGLSSQELLDYFWEDICNQRLTNEVLCPYGQVGDRLWVRETFADGFIDGIGSTIIYKADNPDFDKDFLKNGKWEPSIFMPREASRITRENTEIRIERVADISEQDAIGEGIYDVGKDIGYKKSLWFDYLEKGGDQGGSYLGFKDPIKSYKSLWDSINNIPKLNKKLDSYFVYPFDEQSATKWGNTYRNKSLIVIPNPWAWVIKFKKLSLEEV
jgi:hypothetical protein